VPFSEVITNGTLLTAGAIETILDARLSRVIVSIDGGTKPVFEMLRPGARFEQVVANWNALRAARESRRDTLPVLRINHVLSEPNIDTFDDLLDLAEELNADELSVRTVSRMSEATIQQSSDAAFWRKVRAARASLAAFCTRTGIRDSGFLRDRPVPIELSLDSGETMTCRYPWDWLSIYPNGDAFPCMAWSRPRIGSFVDQTFDEIWNGPALAELRREFEAVRPGIDCLHCTIRKSADDPDDDFFYRKLAMPSPPLQRP
jgi:radical SAM protein with 4Fe4S-binding SPASM domain